MTTVPPSNAEQKASPSYRLAALDPDFLLGESTRGVRFMLEYEKAIQLRTVARGHPPVPEAGEALHPRELLPMHR